MPSKIHPKFVYGYYVRCIINIFSLIIMSLSIFFCIFEFFINLNLLLCSCIFIKIAFFCWFRLYLHSVSFIFNLNTFFTIIKESIKICFYFFIFCLMRRRKYFPLIYLLVRHSLHILYLLIHYRSRIIKLSSTLLDYRLSYNLHI